MRADLPPSTPAPPAQSELPPIFARSQAMRSVVAAIDVVAGQPGGVIVSGEPGSGRRLLARWIHARSRFRAGPFIEVDCAASGDIGACLFGVLPAEHARRPTGKGPGHGGAEGREAAREREDDIDGNGRRKSTEGAGGGDPETVPAAIAAGAFLSPLSPFEQSGRRPAGATLRHRFVPGPLPPRVPDVISADSLVARARGGTLLFVNLPEMPDRDQARLARLLRDGEAAIADTRGAAPLGLRAMAIVDSSWDEALVEGRVRQDLNRHLASARLPVPPLRERREDIADLAAWFLERVCASARLAAKVFTQPVIALLEALPYRGNAAELKQLVETLALRTPGKVVRLDTLLSALDFEPRPGGHALGGTLKEARARFERQYIIAMLEQHKGRPGPAAEALGIQRTNLYRKMRELGIRLRRTPPPRNVG
ncbi:MAG: sigma-54-dependent transcriptional regulator [Vicinamibacterales bacterium]